MARRPTVKDVAREAGVSIATVDRALNGRATVREETLRRIADAAERVGFHARGLISRRLDPAVPGLRLGVVLVKEQQAFYQDFARELADAVAARRDIRGEIEIRYAHSQSPEEFAALMRELGQRSDALACVAVNHQLLSHVVEELKQGGVPTFSLLNDFAQGVRSNYLGLNNLKVGRQAAWIITRTLCEAGKLAIFVGGNRWHGHDLREVGFRTFIREHAPGFSVLDTLVNLEARQITYEATLDLLHRHPDLRGIYVAGGGMEGAIQALRENRGAGEVALVVNELTPETRAALLDGYVLMVIATPLRDLCRDLVSLAIDERRAGSDGSSRQHFLESRLVLPESV